MVTSRPLICMTRDGRGYVRLLGNKTREKKKQEKLTGRREVDVECCVGCEREKCAQRNQRLDGGHLGRLLSFLLCNWR